MNVDVYAPPPVHNVLDGPANPYSYNRLLMTRVKALGSFTTRCCTKALQEELRVDQLLAEEQEEGDDEPIEIPPSFLVTQVAVVQAIGKLYDQWLRFYVASAALMREIHDLKMEDGRAYKTTLGAHVFYELTRLHWLLAQPQLLLERENMVRIPANQWVASDYDRAFALCHTKADVWISITASAAAATAPAKKTKAVVTEPDAVPDATEPVHVKAARQLRQRLSALWTTPIMQYTASQARLMAAFLTQNINEVGEATMDEFRRVFRILWLRCAVLAMQPWPRDLWSMSLDDPEMRIQLPPPDQDKADANRPWAVYCSFYLGEVARRFFHYQLFRGRVMDVPPEAISPEAVHHIKEWITKSVVGTFAEEAFEEIHQGVVTERDGAYDFPGDGQWFRYANPQSVATLGATITQVRPHLYERFFSEEQVDRNVVLAAVDRSHLARLFVLHALDAYIKITHARVEFMHGVVIDNGGIEQSAYVLKTGAAPLLLQVFGRYWVYWKGRVHISDDLWTTLALWWWLLREHYQSKLYGIDMSAHVDEALLPRVRVHAAGTGGGAAAGTGAQGPAFEL